jgi:hypothetical protein
MIEIERQKKVLSMMMTAHSVLRDRYLLFSSIFEISLLIGSVILNVVVFIDENYIFRMTGLSIDIQKLIAGIASITVFTISIVLLQVRWKEKAESHSIAVNKLSKMMQECRTIINIQDGTEKEERAEKFSEKYNEEMNSIVEIPEKKFNSLKMIHYRKVELSKLIEKYPKSHLWVLKIRMFLSSFREKNN